MKAEIDEITVGKYLFYTTAELRIIWYILNSFRSPHVGLVDISDDLLEGDWCVSR